jgi:demethylmenaquinone methyltransferase/2-methoxy-6-polyprenyl-1,4-benzoquinol methylase
MPDSELNPEGWAERVRHVYDRVAGRYDGALALFGLLGYRTGAYRRRAVRALRVRPGQTVVDLGCGTGKNLPLLAEAVGAEGRVIGVDFSPAMLEEARARIEENGLANVELVEADAATFDYPDGLDRVLATFSLSMMPEPERVIARAARALEARALSPEGRLAVLDFRIPPSWPQPIRRAAFALAAPLGETWAMAERDLRPLARRHVSLDTDESLYFGAAYVAAGLPHPPA